MFKQDGERTVLPFHMRLNRHGGVNGLSGGIVICNAINKKCSLSLYVFAWSSFDFANVCELVRMCVCISA